MPSKKDATTTTASLLAASLALALAAIGCSGAGAPKSEPPKPAPAPAPQATAPAPPPAPPTEGEEISEAAEKEAEQIYATRCTPCHGDKGKGDGAAAAGLNPKPRDYSSKEWQASVTDAHIEKVILEGGPSVGMSVLMPPNPDLAGKPEVVKALRAHVRELGEQH